MYPPHFLHHKLSNVLSLLRVSGIFFIIPCTDTYRKVDLRVVSFDVPPQEVMKNANDNERNMFLHFYRKHNVKFCTFHYSDLK